MAHGNAHPCTLGGKLPSNVAAKETGAPENGYAGVVHILTKPDKPEPDRLS